MSFPGGSDGKEFASNAGDPGLCLFPVYSKSHKKIKVLVAQSGPTLCGPMDCSPPGLPVHHQLPEFTQTHVHRVSDAIQPSHPLSSPSPPAVNLFQHQALFQWVSSSHQVAKYQSFSFSIGPCNEYSGLISFRMDWLDLLEVQGTLRSLLQNHSSKASILGGQRASPLSPVLLVNTTQEKTELVLHGDTTDTPQGPSQDLKLWLHPPHPTPEKDPDQRCRKSTAFTMKSVTTKNTLPKAHRLQQSTELH